MKATTRLSRLCIIGAGAALSIGLAGAASGQAYARTIRATELATLDLAKLADSAPGDELVVEFRQGDRVPITLEAQGDLLETEGPAPVAPVTVKRTFFVKFANDQLLMSFDGSMYSPVKDLLTGTVTVGASGQPAASAINVALKAVLKN